VSTIMVTRLSPGCRVTDTSTGTLDSVFGRQMCDRRTCPASESQRFTGSKANPPGSTGHSAGACASTYGGGAARAQMGSQRLRVRKTWPRKPRSPWGAKLSSRETIESLIDVLAALTYGCLDHRSRGGIVYDRSSASRTCPLVD